MSSIMSFLIDLNNQNILWLLIPIFFIGIITDKYQEQKKTDIGNAISNASLIIFTSFNWVNFILNQDYILPILISQLIFVILMIIYGILIISSGFLKNEFAIIYGRIRVITYFLMFFSLMIYMPKYFFNFKVLTVGVIIFPIYYFLISKLIMELPNANINKKAYKKLKNKIIN